MAQEIVAKSMLNKTKRRDPWFLDDYTVNPYSACSFNCLYCYIRGSRYGEHMTEKVSVKTNALEVLDRQLYNRAKKKQYGIIVLSSATDPYLQFEKTYRLTRQILERILYHKFPVHIITKSDLVTRDFDILEQIGKEAILPADLQYSLKQKVFITFSFSTLDDAVAGIFEPGAPPPQTRLETLRQALAASFHAGVSLMPLLPYITDRKESLQDMFAAFHQLNVRYVFPASLTLFGSQPYDSKMLMLNAIRKHYPDLEEKYRQLFAYGFQPPRWYLNHFNKIIQQLNVQYCIPNTLFQDTP